MKYIIKGHLSQILLLNKENAEVQEAVVLRK